MFDLSQEKQNNLYSILFKMRSAILRNYVAERFKSYKKSLGDKNFKLRFQETLKNSLDFNVEKNEKWLKQNSVNETFWVKIVQWYATYLFLRKKTDGSKLTLKMFLSDGVSGGWSISA